MRDFKIRASHTTSVKPISPFRYPGGKSWLTPQIQTWLSEVNCNELLEPFAGGASVSLYALFDGLVDTIYINELDEDIYNFWLSALNKTEELCSIIDSFVAEEERAREVITKWKYQEDIGELSLSERAFMTLLRNRLARNGVMTNKAGFLRKGDKNGLFSRWYPDTMVRRIKKISSYKDGIVLSNLDGIKLMRQRSFKSCAIFIDPPYIDAGKYLYKHNKVKHADIFSFASTRDRDVLITYDKSATIIALAQKYGLDSVEIDMMSGTNIRKAELLISKNLEWSVTFDDRL